MELTQELINVIFNIATIEPQTPEDVFKYEELYKIDLFEALADYLNANYDDEEAEEIEESYLMVYNPENLVTHFKKI